MKKYASSDSIPWNLGRVFMNYGFNSKLFPFASGSFMQEGSDEIITEF